MNCIIAAWDKHEQELRNYLRQQTRDEGLAEDLLQETFLKALAEGSRFCALENSRAWLFRVTKNRLIDYRRTHKTYTELPDDLAESPPAELPVVDLLTQCLPRALKEMSLQDGEVITLCDIEGMTQSDYAILKDITPAGAKSRIQRARKRLKQHLEQVCRVRYDEFGEVCCFTPRKTEG